MHALILKSIERPQISTNILLFRYKFATPIFSSPEFDLNLVIAMQRHMKHMSSLLRKNSKTAAVIAPVVIEKLVYDHIEQLQYGFSDINTILMIICLLNDPVHS